MIARSLEGLERPDVLDVALRHSSTIGTQAARAVSADLIVMGGYGHTRIRERVFGGVTVDMLAESEKPILLAH